MYKKLKQQIYDLCVRIFCILSSHILTASKVSQNLTQPSIDKPLPNPSKLPDQRLLVN